MKNKLKKFIAALLLLSVFVPFSVTATSFGNYQSRSEYYSYEYNAYNELTAAPDCYTATDVIRLSDAGVDMSTSVVSDIFYDGNRIYALDAALGRIIVLKKDFSLDRIIRSSDLSCGAYPGVDLNFTGAGGLFVEKDGQILICDTERERILFIRDTVLTGLIERPKTSVIPSDIKFDVKKIVRTGANYYVVAESIVSGVVVFNENLEFLRLFGNNKVAITSEVLLQKLQSIYMSDEQIAARRKFTASKINGIDVDSNGFIVVTSSDPGLTVSGSAVRCLNFKGSEISLGNEEDTFGDKLITQDSANAFCDIAVTDDNFYALLDKKYGRVFVYSEKGILVGVFGGLGDETGLFGKPISLEKMDDKILVLDSDDNAITVFSVTGYGKIKKELIGVIDGGNYKETERLTDELLKFNTNCQYAHYAKGFIAQQKKDYKTSMTYYKLANDRNSYAQVFKLYRSQLLKNHFPVALLVSVLLIAAIAAVVVWLGNGLRKKEGELYSPLESKKAGFPIFCLFHPADGFSQIKSRKVLSPVWLCSILVIWIYTVISGYFLRGFIHNPNRPEDFNIFIELVKTVCVLAVFTIANWTICTLMDGKGKPKEIVYTVCYSMIPYVLALIVSILMTRVLTAEEAVIISIVMTVGKLWTGIVMFVGLLTIHEYSVGKAVFAVALTLVGMLVIMLLAVMFFTLMGQTVSFVQSIIMEYTLQH